MTKEQKCIAELWMLLTRIEDGAYSHDLSLLRVPRGASGDILNRYEDIINAAVNAELTEEG